MYNYVLDIPKDVIERAVEAIDEHFNKEYIDIYLTGSICHNRKEYPVGDIDIILLVKDYSDAILTTLEGYPLEAERSIMKPSNPMGAAYKHNKFETINYKLELVFQKTVDFFVQGESVFNFLKKQSDNLPYYNVRTGECINFEPYVEYTIDAEDHKDKFRDLYKGTGTIGKMQPKYQDKRNRLESRIKFAKREIRNAKFRLTVHTNGREQKIKDAIRRLTVYLKITEHDYDKMMVEEERINFEGFKQDELNREQTNGNT